jgi:hypothetical protein
MTIVMIAPYSQSKLIVPASKVSVPLTVVMRTRSSVVAVVLAPERKLFLDMLVKAKFPIPTQTLLPKVLKIIAPDRTSVAEVVESIRNPVEKLDVPTPVVCATNVDPAYDEVSTPLVVPN